MKFEGHNKWEDYLNKSVRIETANFNISVSIKQLHPKLVVVSVNPWLSAGYQFTNSQQMALDHAL